MPTSLMLPLALAAAVGLLGCEKTEPGTDAAPGTDAGPQLPVDVTVFDGALISGVSGNPNFHTLIQTVELPAGDFSSITLTYAVETLCNEPPNFWGDDCDPFDRLATVQVETPGGTIELLRAITPFGGDATWTADVTDMAPVLTGTQTLRAHITVWADGSGMLTGANASWRVTVGLHYEPGDPPGTRIDVLPIHDAEIGSGSLPVTVDVTVPDGVANALVYIRSTGHGSPGCDEFCMKLNRLFVDGVEVYAFTPWRNDCATFCTDVDGDGSCDQNPWGLPASVFFSRAGWCPSDVVEPVVFGIPLSPGPHTFVYDVENAEASWRIGLHAVLLP